jgi:hypothetical protein
MEASMLRVGEKIVKVRITFHEEAVFVSARDDKRLLDYFRFTKKEFNKEKAMERIRDRFRIAKLLFLEEADNQLLDSLKTRAW